MTVEHSPDPDRERGLYGKYFVKKIKSGELVDPGPVFVLAYVTDPHARVALAAYATSCEADYSPLAADLRAALEATRDHS